MKLFKFVASSGLLSRRKSQESIKSALVTVNNIVEMDPFVYINPEKDIVRLDGQKIKFRRKSETIVLHKPKGFICSRSDELDRKTIFDLIMVNTYMFLETSKLLSEKFNEKKLKNSSFSIGNSFFKISIIFFSKEISP